MADRERLSLCHGCMAEVPASAFVAAAAKAGFSRVSIRLAAPPDGVRAYPGNGFGAARQGEVRDLLAQHGMRLEEVEYAVLTPLVRPGDFDPLFEGGAAMGARDVVALARGFNEEEAVTEAFAGFCREAAGYGLGVLLEFIAISSVPSLASACRIIAGSGAAAARISVDILHLLRSGDGVEALADVDPTLLAMGQLCDGPLEGPEDVDAQRREMSIGRMRLGDGAFPIRQFIEAMPAAAPLGIEVLRAARPRDAEAAEAEARMLMRSALPYLVPAA